MGLRNTTTEWGSLAKALHWLVAIGILVLIYLGLEQSEMERGDAKANIRMIHASIAMLVFGLMSLRLVWRWMNETPAHPPGFPAWQNWSATLVHWGLYAAVFVQSMAGIMTIATAGSGIPFFGLFKLHLPIDKDSDAHHFWEEVHEYTWQIMAILLAVHVLGALYNHFVLKNDVLRRMTHGVRQAGG